MVEDVAETGVAVDAAARPEESVAAILVKVDRVNSVAIPVAKVVFQACRWGRHHRKRRLHACK